jgi:hypothetical protein
VITAAGAVAIAVALGSLPAAYGDTRQSVLVALAGIAVVATLIALFGKNWATWWAVVALGAEYALFIVGRDRVDVRAPIVGAGLLVLAELIHWSVRARASERNEAGTSGRQLVDLGSLWLGSLAAGSFVVAVRDVGNPGSLGLTVAGVVACGATLGLVLMLARRTKPAGGRFSH